MLFFIVSYGHTVIISQMEFSLCDKYNNYVHFFKLLPWDNKSMIMLEIKSEAWFWLTLIFLSFYWYNLFQKSYWSIFKCKNKIKKLKYSALSPWDNYACPEEFTAVSFFPYISLTRGKFFYYHMIFRLPWILL